MVFHYDKKVQDVAGVELYGTLKNVVVVTAGTFLIYICSMYFYSLGYLLIGTLNGISETGFVDGLKLGNNTKVIPYSLLNLCFKARLRMRQNSLFVHLLGCSNENWLK